MDDQATAEFRLVFPNENQTRQDVMRELNLGIMRFMGKAEGNLMEFLIVLTKSAHDHAGGHGHIVLAKNGVGVSFEVVGCCARCMGAAPDLSVLQQQAKDCGVADFVVEMSECLTYRGNYLNRKS